MNQGDYVSARAGYLCIGILLLLLLTMFVAASVCADPIYVDHSSLCNNGVLAPELSVVTSDSTSVTVDISVTNNAYAWYYVSVQPMFHGSDTSGLPDHFMLGPHQKHYFVGRMQFHNNDSLTLFADGSLNHKEVIEYIIADGAFRLIVGSQLPMDEAETFIALCGEAPDLGGELISFGDALPNTFHEPLATLYALAKLYEDPLLKACFVQAFGTVLPDLMMNSWDGYLKVLETVYLEVSIILAQHYDDLAFTGHGPSNNHPADNGTPNAPSPLSPTGGAAVGRNITFIWRDNGTSTGGDCSSFNVKVRATGSSSILNLGWNTGTIKSWTSGYGNYQWMVEAKSSNGKIADSGWVGFSVSAPTPPALQVSDWATVQNTGTIGLKVRSSANGTFTGAKLSDGDVIQILDGPVLAGSDWWYRHDHGGWSAFASTYNGNYYVYMQKTTPPAPPAIRVSDWILTQNTANILEIRDNPCGISIGYLMDGLTLQIIGGPVYKGGIWWYQHEKGWSAYASVYHGTYNVYMQKTTPPSLPPIASGDWALTTNTAGILRVRSGPDGADTGKRLQDGMYLNILGGPTFAGGLWWYQHDNGGWSAYSSTYQGTTYIYMDKTSPPGTPPLVPGDTAMTQNTLGMLRVRSGPDGTDTGQRLTDYYTLNITAGPVFASGLWWYGYNTIISGSPVSGWSAYAVDGGIMMVRVDPSVPPLMPGDTAITQNCNVNNIGILRVRDGYGLKANVLGKIGDGLQLQIIDGPVSADGLWWYHHQNSVQSGWSAYAQADVYMKLVPPPVPASPTNLRVDISSPCTLNLLWDDNSNNETGFSVELMVNDSYVQIGSVAANVTRFAMADLEATNSYTFRVCAGNKGGSSAYTNELTVTMPPMPPAAPSNLSAQSASTSTTQLTWTDCSNNEAGFAIERKSGTDDYAEIGRVDANTTTYTDNRNISADIVYTYRVRAFNTGGYSAYAEERGASVLLAMIAPVGLRTATVTPNSVSLMWSPCSNAVTYGLERKTADGTYSEIAQLVSDATTYEDTGLTPSTPYFYRILAYGDGVNSDYTNELPVSTLAPVPAQPTQLISAPASTHSIELCWNSGDSTAKGAYVERKTVGGEYSQVATLNPGVVSYVDDGLLGSNSYTYRVCSFNDSGSSDYSNETTQMLEPFVSVDAAAGVGTRDALIGDGLFYPDFQVVSQPIIGSSATFHVKATNLSNIGQQVLITSMAYGKGYSVRYFDSQTRAEITNTVATPEGMSLFMSPGAVYELRIEETFDAGVGDARCEVGVDFNAAQSGVRDQVWALASRNVTLPLVDIASPSSTGIYVSPTQNLSVGGYAFGNGINGVTWSTDRGCSGSCLGTNSWSADGIPLQKGRNVITVTASDSSGNIGAATLTVDYSTSPQGILLAGLAEDGSIWYTNDMAVWRGVPGALSTLALGDFNGDNQCDICGLASDGSVWYTTDESNWINIPGRLQGLAVGDFSGSGSDGITGLAQNGSIWYTTDLTSWQSVSGRLGSLIAADFGGAGKHGIAGIASDNSIWCSSDMATWANVPGYLSEIIAGDFDGDSKDGLAGIASDNTIWYTNSLTSWMNVPGQLTWIVAGDFAGSGKTGLAGLAGDGSIWYATDNINWRNIPGCLNSLVSGDFNGDGKDELAGLAGDGSVWYTTDLQNWTNVPGRLASIYTVRK